MSGAVRPAPRGSAGARVALAAAAALVLLTPSGSAAQEPLTGRVLDRETGEPVRGALLWFAAENGRRIARGLTSGRGLFRLAVPGGVAGTLRVERIGYAPETVAVEPGDRGRFLTLRVASRPVALDALEVVGESLCGDVMETDPLVHGVWEEARKALRMTALAGEDAISAYRTERWRRRLDPVERRVVEGTTTSRVIRSPRPYRPTDPAEIRARGWVAEEGDELVYSAPDAYALLDRSFAAEHCFRVERRDSVVALVFTPNRERRELPELEGEFLLDRETWELQELDYRYVSLPLPPQGDAEAGGRVRFARAPNGLRVVRDWVVRMPVLAPERRSWEGRTARGFRLAAVVEEGGRVLGIESGGVEVALAGGARITGTLIRGGRGMEGAVVAVTGTGLETRTDSAGTFVLTGIVPGRYTLRTRHPALDTLPLLEAVEVPVDVPEAAAEVRVSLGAPTVMEHAWTVCPAREWAGLPAPLTPAGAPRVLHGVATGPGRRAVVDLPVEVTWSHWALDTGSRPGLPEEVRSRMRERRNDPVVRSIVRTHGQTVSVEESRWSAATTTDALGRWLVCGVSPRTVTVAWRRGLLSGEEAVAVERERIFTRVDLSVPR